MRLCVRIPCSLYRNVTDKILKRNQQRPEAKRVNLTSGFFLIDISRSGLYNGVVNSPAYDNEMTYWIDHDSITICAH